MSLTLSQQQQIRTNAVGKMASHVGELEQPLYSNRSDFIDRCNNFVGNAPVGSQDGAPWCLAADEYCVDQAARLTGQCLADTALVKTGYCPELYLHAKSIGTAVDPADVVSGKTTVLPGDTVLVFYPTEDGGRLPHHAEMLETVPTRGNPHFVSLGGNTVPDGVTAVGGHENQGYGLYRKQRNALDTIPGGHNHYVFIRLFPL